MLNIFECTYKCKDGKRVRFLMTTPMDYSRVEIMMNNYKDYAVYTLSKERADYLRSRGYMLRSDFNSCYN